MTTDQMLREVLSDCMVKLMYSCDKRVFELRINSRYDTVLGRHKSLDTLLSEYIQRKKEEREKII